MNISTPPRCAHCNSELIFMGEKTFTAPGSSFPQTITTYRCSNVECQEAQDKETAKRIQAKAEKDAALAARLAAKQKEKEEK